MDHKDIIRIDIFNGPSNMNGEMTLGFIDEEEFDLEYRMRLCLSELCSEVKESAFSCIRDTSYLYIFIKRTYDPLYFGGTGYTMRVFRHCHCLFT